MARYSVDPDRGELIAAWGTGEGDLATRVATLPADAGTSVLLGLALAVHSWRPPALTMHKQKGR